MSHLSAFLLSLVTVLKLTDVVQGFSVPDTFHFVHTAAATFSRQTHAGELLAAYKHQLASYPLSTKMITGAALAVCGDAIAQPKTIDEPYDTSRASSFAIFDSVYRALQHHSFPIIVAKCQGQFLGGLF